MSPLGEFQVTLHPSELQRTTSLMISTRHRVLLDASYSCPPFSKKRCQQVKSQQATCCCGRLLPSAGTTMVNVVGCFASVKSRWAKQQHLLCCTFTVQHRKQSILWRAEHIIFHRWKFQIGNSEQPSYASATVGVRYCFMNLWMLIVLFLHRKSCRILHCLCLTRSSPFTFTVQFNSRLEPQFNNLACM